MEFCYKCDNGILLHTIVMIFVTSVMMEFCYKCDYGILLQVWWRWSKVSAVDNHDLAAIAVIRTNWRCWPGGAKYSFSYYQFICSILWRDLLEFLCMRKLLSKSNDDVYIKVRGGRVVVPNSYSRYQGVCVQCERWCVSIGCKSLATDCQLGFENNNQQ